GREGGRAAADREVRVAHLRSDGARCLAGGGQMLGEARGLPPQLAAKLLRVADVLLERLLGADRDSLCGKLERAGVDPARAVTEQETDLARKQPPQVVVGERGKPTDRRHARP